MAVCRANTEAWVAAVATGDPARIGALFSAEAVWVSEEGLFRGPQEITRFVEAWLQPGAKHVAAITAAREVGDVVLCSGETTFTFAPGSPIAAKEVKNRWGEALTRSGDGWLTEQLTTSHGEPIPLPPQPQRDSLAR